MAGFASACCTGSVIVFSVSPTAADSSTTGRVAIAAAAVLFGTSATSTRLVDGLPDALTVAAWRQVIGGVALVVVAAVIGQAVWRYPFRWRPTIVGGVAVVAFQVGFFSAVDRLGVATATMVVIGTGPIAGGLLDRLIDGKRPTRRWVAGVAVAITGISMMSGGGGDVVMAHWLLAVAAGWCFPIYGAATGRLLADRPPVAAIATVFGAGVLPAATLAALGATGIAVAGSPLGTTGAGAATTVAVLGYLGLVTTAAAYVLWAHGLARLPLGEAVTITMLEPVAAFVLAVVVLREPVGVVPTVGALAVLAGIRIVATRPRRRGLALRRRAGRDLVDVTHRGPGSDHREQHKDRADRQHDPLVAQAAAHVVEVGA
jgi:drug/metabolite transporter, DME family